MSVEEQELQSRIDNAVTKCKSINWVELSDKIFNHLRDEPDLYDQEEVNDNLLELILQQLEN